MFCHLTEYISLSVYEHLRVKTQTNTVMTPPARVGYEKVDTRKGKYLPVGFTIVYIDPLQHVDSSCSIHFLEHTSPVLKKKRKFKLKVEFTR